MYGLFDLDEGFYGAVTAEMNQFTNNLFNLTTNGNLATTNSGTNATNDANHFFANVNIATGLDNASTIQVNPSLTANASLLYNGTSGVDPESIQAVRSLGISCTRTFSSEARRSTLVAAATSAIRVSGSSRSRGPEVFELSAGTPIRHNASSASTPMTRIGPPMRIALRGRFIPLVYRAGNQGSPAIRWAPGLNL